jgi:hypothetical protein
MISDLDLKLTGLGLADVGMRKRKAADPVDNSSAKRALSERTPHDYYRQHPAKSSAFFSGRSEALRAACVGALLGLGLGHHDGSRFDD